MLRNDRIFGASGRILCPGEDGSSETSTSTTPLPSLGYLGDIRRELGSSAWE